MCEAFSSSLASISFSTIRTVSQHAQSCSSCSWHPNPHIQATHAGMGDAGAGACTSLLMGLRTSHRGEC